MASTTSAAPKPPTPKITPPASDQMGQRRKTRKPAEATDVAMVIGARPARGTAGRHDATRAPGPTTTSHPAHTGTGRATPAGFGNPLYAYLGIGDMAIAGLRSSAEWPTLQRTVTREAAKMQAAWKADLEQLNQSLTLEKMMRTGLSLDQLRGLPGRAKRGLVHLDDYATPVGTIAVSVGDVAASLGDAAAHWYRELVARGERVATSHR